jgi:AraC-like DNA-binding protein
MEIFLPALNILGFCIGLIVCYILLFANRTRTPGSVLLLILMLGLTLASLQGILTTTGYIVRLPHFFRAFSPFFYLMIPTVYLYLKTSLHEEKKFRKSDWIHFFPAVLHFLELIPWYLHGTAYKKAWISHSLSNPDFVIQLKEGLLPPYWHNTIRCVLASVYLIAVVDLWRRTPTAKKKLTGIIHFVSFRRLRIMFLAMVFLMLYFTATLLSPAHIGRADMISIMIACCFITFGFFLFSEPHLLYGFVPNSFGGKKEPANELDEHSRREGIRTADPFGCHQPVQQVRQNIETSIITSTLEEYLPMLEKALLSRPYLRQGYSLVSLSQDSGIPRHYLSALLNKIYGTRFNDFINHHRIQYISENLNDPNWNFLTLEGIAHEAGFNSRTTFFYAIKKFTGLSPREFLEKAKRLRDETGSNP